MRKNCPKCDQDISDTYQPAELDVGIMSGGWWCKDCDEFVEEEGDFGDLDLLGG